MKRKLLFRLPFFVIGLILALILNEFTPPLTDRQYMWWIVAYIIIGLSITEVLISRKNKTERNR